MVLLNALRPAADLALGLGHHFQVGYVEQHGPTCALHAPQHTSLQGPAWLKDAGPSGAGNEADGKEQEHKRTR